MEPSKQQSQSLEIHRLSVSVQTFFPPQLLVIKITIHRMHLSTQLYLRDFFFFLTEMNCSLNKPLLSSHPRLFWKEYWLHSMQLQCMDFPILQLGLPLNLLTTSPSLLTFLLFTLPQPFFLLLQKKLPYAMLLLFCLFHWFWTLKGLVYVSSCCVLCTCPWNYTWQILHVQRCGWKIARINVVSVSETPYILDDAKLSE